MRETYKTKKHGEVRGIRKGAVLISALKKQISNLEKPNEEYMYPEPGVKLRFHSKYLDKIHIRFRGPGIMDAEYNEMIKRRTVWLRRYELTDEFDGR